MSLASRHAVRGAAGSSHTILRALGRRHAGGGGGEGFWEELGLKKYFGPGTQKQGQGLLFGESPPPPGEARQWEAWEVPYYFTLASATALFWFGSYIKPDTNITTWAHKEALKRLHEKEARERESDAIATV